MNDIETLLEQARKDLHPLFEKNKFIAQFNFEKVMRAFKDFKLSESDFMGTTGYGYDDIGRDKLERIYASVFKGEDALVRSQIISGTHAISLVLLGLLETHDELLYITGEPYDTLHKIIGSKEDYGSLKYHGVDVNIVDLKDDAFDVDSILNAISDKTKMIGIQRSRGYSKRKSMTVDEIGMIVEIIKETYPNVIVFVDNCYGEFVETKEPLEVGADIIAGSLIKNPGGGLAKMGGYVVGSKDLIEKVSYRLTVPGIGKEMGASLGELHSMYQGFFFSPHVVIESLNGAILTSYVLDQLGMVTDPHYKDSRTDLIQSIMFDNAEEMIKFAQSVQDSSPVNSMFTPIPDSIPGYNDPVIMAAGTFIQGASLELSADGPIRPPYRLYMQGGLVFEHVYYTLKNALQNIKS